MKAGDLTSAEDPAESEVTHTILSLENRPLFEQRLNIPEMAYRAISQVHNSITGHRGVERTTEAFQTQNFVSPKLRQYVKEFINRCPCCKR